LCEDDRTDSRSSHHMRNSNLASSCEDDRADSRSSHGMLDEQVSRLLNISKHVTEEGLCEILEDA